MKIDFKVNSQGRIELANGNILDSQILEFYDHDSFANGTGWVDLPEGLINGKDVFKGATNKELPKMDEKGNMQVTIPGPQIHTDEPRKLGLRFENNKLVEGNGLTQKEIDDYNNRYATGNGDPNFRVRDEDGPGSYLGRDPNSFAGNSSSQGQQSLVDMLRAEQERRLWANTGDDTLETIFHKTHQELINRKIGQYAHLTWTHPVEQKIRMMNALGFVRHLLDRWHHPILGSNLEQNWLYFNPETDEISQVVTMLFKSGFVKGQFKVRMDIKAALDIR